LLIKSYKERVLFKSIRPQDATPTSFSAYRDYGIELGLRDYYYTLPKKGLSIQEVFIHSLDSAVDLSQKLFCVLFYLKNRNELESIEHPMMMISKRCCRARESVAILPWMISWIGRISMTSSSNRISTRVDINELFEQLGKDLEQRVEALLIGGAVMLELGLKDSTKDIDIVCWVETDKEWLLGVNPSEYTACQATRHGICLEIQL